MSRSREGFVYERARVMRGAWGWLVLLYLGGRAGGGSNEDSGVDVYSVREVGLDWHVDEVMVRVRKSLHQQGLNWADLQNIHVQGRVQCEGGYLEGLASLHRAGPAVLSTRGANLTLSVALAVDSLTAGYTKCSISLRPFLPMNISSMFEISVDTNAFSFNLTAHAYTPGCPMSIDYLNIDVLSGMTVKTGTSIWKKIKDFILNLMIKIFKPVIRYAVNRKLRSLIKYTIPHFKICSFFPVNPLANLTT